jgi:hypothetical protein
MPGQPTAGSDPRLSYETAKAQGLPIIRRDDLLEDAIKAIDQAIAERSTDSKRLILIQANAGVGKSWMLDMLRERLLSRRDKPVRCTDIWDVASLIAQKDEGFASLHQLCNQCELSSPALPSESPRIETRVIALTEAYAMTGAGQSLVVFLDNLEALRGQMTPPTLHYKNLRNLFMLRLLTCVRAPVIFVCAVRNAPGQAIAFLNHPALRQTIHNVPLSEFTEPQIEVEYGLTDPELRTFVWQMSEGNALSMWFFSQPNIKDEFDKLPNVVAQKAVFLFLRDLDLNEDRVKRLAAFIKKNGNSFDADAALTGNTIDQSLHDLIQNMIVNGLAEWDAQHAKYSLVKPLAALLIHLAGN